MKSIDLISLAFSMVVLSTQVQASSSSSFQNTAPLLVQSNHYDSYYGNQYKYAMSLDKATAILNKVTHDVCQSSKTSPEKLLYLKVHNMDINQPDLDNAKLTKVADHVLYPSKDTDDESNTVSDACDSPCYFNAVSNDEFLPSLIDQDCQVSIVEIDQNELAGSLADQVMEITGVFPAENIIVEGLPTFEAPDSLLKQASKFLGLTNQQGKREHDASEAEKKDEEDWDSIEAELKESFDEVNALLEDETVTILDHTDKNTTSSSTGAHAFKNSTQVANSLFDSYGFFSNGIWMTAIVSFFLLWILLTSLSWLQSLQVSYKAFDKQVSGSKKNQ
ncbi:unnamed protein product [Ambrosiozyma monospora]|uniref:Unnamed protein product n=1 Tax=Ambrosiozyma monospora TaxID=43982 RepID=A0ACB5T6C4_AMBMO|nr:unnamed protein product [Ambrosiozyma monospora]